LGPYYYANGKKPGTYSFANGQWTFNGAAIELPAVIDFIPGGFQIRAVDGGKVSKHIADSNIGSTLFVPAGEHSLAVFPEQGQPYELAGTLRAGRHYKVVREKPGTGMWVLEEQGKPYEFRLDPPPAAAQPPASADPSPTAP
jgi:hypothetical protein